MSLWNHTASEQPPAMQRLAGALTACSDAKYTKCKGKLEVRQFTVPGWEDTTPAGAATPLRWPSFTRVNHAKYIVSEQRLNVGTSNWEWCAHCLWLVFPFFSSVWL